MVLAVILDVITLVLGSIGAIAAFWRGAPWGRPGSFSKPVALRYWSRSSSSLWWTGSSFSLPPFSLKRSKNRFPEG